MASVGIVPCTRVIGTPPVLKQTLHTWRVPGINGYGAHRLGYGDAEGEITAVLLSTVLGIEAWGASIYALQGTIVSIVTDRGYTYTHCMIEHCEPLETRAAYIPGTAIRERGEIRMRIKRTA